mgnify:CR=1 FL=1
MPFVGNIKPWIGPRLEPCPFCGDWNAYIPEIEVYSHWVKCQKCEASGGIESTKEMAAQRWNETSRAVKAGMAAQARESELLLHLHALKSFVLMLMDKYREIVVRREGKRDGATYDSRQDPILKRGYELVAITNGIGTEVEDGKNT